MGRRCSGSGHASRGLLGVVLPFGPRLRTRAPGTWVERGSARDVLKGRRQPLRDIAGDSEGAAAWDRRISGIAVMRRLSQYHRILLGGMWVDRRMVLVKAVQAVAGNLARGNHLGRWTSTGVAKGIHRVRHVLVHGRWELRGRGGARQVRLQMPSLVVVVADEGIIRASEILGPAILAPKAQGPKACGVLRSVVTGGVKLVLRHQPIADSAALDAIAQVADVGLVDRSRSLRAQRG
jgi:hypothetical protein